MTRSIAVYDLYPVFQVWVGSVKFNLLLVGAIIAEAKRYSFINTISKPLSDAYC